MKSAATCLLALLARRAVVAQPRTVHEVSREAHRARVAMAKHSYDWSARWERNAARAQILAREADAFNRFRPNWPCFWGEEAVGSGPYGTRTDGWKFICGFRKLQPPCVVYSLGSHGQMDFEAAVLKAKPFCEIHIFDQREYSTEAAFRGLNASHVHFHTMYIAPVDDLTPRRGRPPRRSFASIAKELGHTHVDILKVDIEGGEFEMFGSPIPVSIGQIQVEMHLDSGFFGLGENRVYKPNKNGVGTVVQKRGGRTYDEVHAMVTRFERAGFRLFHKEDNSPGGHFASCPCQEWAWIQQDWTPRRKDYPTLGDA